MWIATDGGKQWIAGSGTLALTTKVPANVWQFVTHGLQVPLEGIDLEGATHAEAPRTSILPVTAAVMRAVRYSCKRSIASSILPTIASILPVSLSRNATIISCSTTGGIAHAKDLTSVIPIVWIVAPSESRSKCWFIAFSVSRRYLGTSFGPQRYATKCCETAMGRVVIAHRPTVASRENTTAPAGRRRAEEFARPSSFIW